MPKFLCDEMLHGLGRWLRAAGYDTAIAEPGTADRMLIEVALNDKRTLITRDRKMNEIRYADRVVLLLLNNELDDCAVELTHKLNLDWQFKPFSRCILCNTLLQSAGNDQRKHAPDDVPKEDDELLYCPQCDKAFWHGSHTDRMSRKLARYNQYHAVNPV